MKVIIAGSRSIRDYSLITKAVEQSGFDVTTEISGGARGVDKMGEQWARENQVQVEVFPAMWDLYGKSAGFRRNSQMARYADALIAVWDGGSHGTAHMIAQMRGMGKPVFVLEVGK